jgi:GNAT superfamily N-acetyltransferase
MPIVPFDPPEVAIRTATDADLDAILALSQTAPWHKEPYLRAELEHGWIDVASNKGSIVGFIVWNREFFSRPCVWLIIIDPQHRNGGIGSLLYAHVERKCEGERLYSSTNRSNVRMQRFFERRGYTRAGEIELDPGDPEAFYYVDL